MTNNEQTLNDVDYWIRAATQARQAEMQMRRELEDLAAKQLDKLEQQIDTLRVVKPVAWISKHGVVYPIDAKDEVHPINDLQPLYTVPNPARTAKPLTDEQIEAAMPGGIYDSLNDPWDCGVGDGDTLRSIKADVIRIARAIEQAHGITGETK